MTELNDRVTFNSLGSDSATDSSFYSRLEKGTVKTLSGAAKCGKFLRGVINYYSKTGHNYNAKSD